MGPTGDTCPVGTHGVPWGPKWPHDSHGPEFLNFSNFWGVCSSSSGDFEPRWVELFEAEVSNGEDENFRTFFDFRHRDPKWGQIEVPDPQIMRKKFF